VFDLVHPGVAGWRLRRFDGQAGRDEAGRERHGTPARSYWRARGAVAVPVMRPLASRNVRVPLASRVLVPVIRPLPSR
jgi:hypothetical protein